ncbi:hypothetical protein [Parafrankia sp. FMc2]|uniref:hypothetical protein n=1 Tax=Parafrankia sp. FMc2 TaxID=3233196 RepID=UPI0034D5DC0C
METSSAGSPTCGRCGGARRAPGRPPTSSWCRPSPPPTRSTYPVDAMLADPIRLNARLGRYTTFANLLGLPVGAGAHPLLTT